jgi:hypothetical protein
MVRKRDRCRICYVIFDPETGAASRIQNAAPNMFGHKSRKVLNFSLEDVRIRGRARRRPKNIDFVILRGSRVILVEHALLEFNVHGGFLLTGVDLVGPIWNQKKGRHRGWPFRFSDCRCSLHYAASSFAGVSTMTGSGNFHRPSRISGRGRYSRTV